MLYPRTFNVGPPAPQASAAAALPAEAHAPPAKVHRAVSALGATATDAHVHALVSQCPLGNTPEEDVPGNPVLASRAGFADSSSARTSDKRSLSPTITAKQT